jgi:hypothetical protein
MKRVAGILTILSILGGSAAMADPHFDRDHGRGAGLSIVIGSRKVVGVSTTISGGRARSIAMMIASLATATAASSMSDTTTTMAGSMIVTRGRMDDLSFGAASAPRLPTTSGPTDDMTSDVETASLSSTTLGHT